MIDLHWIGEVDFWRTNKDWYWYDENDDPHIKDDAPEEAKKSFELWMSPDPRP